VAVSSPCLLILVHEEPEEPITLCSLQMNWLSFEKLLVEVQDLRKITDHFRGVCGIYFKLIKKNPKDHNM